MPQHIYNMNFTSPQICDKSIQDLKHCKKNGNGELVRTTCTNLCWGPKLDNTVNCDQIVDDIKNHGSSMMCEMIDTKLEEKMVNSQYYNVSYSLRIIFLVYFIQNVLGVILQIPYLCFKMKKGLF